jgi:tyrosine phenol-lyase
MISEPYRGKIISSLKVLDYSERLNIAEEYGWNIHKIPTGYVLVDFYDYTHNALSDFQFGGLFLGDEAYAGSENFLNIEKKVKEIFGKSWVVPAHNLRGAEHLLFKALLEGKRFFASKPTETLKVLAKYFKSEILELSEFPSGEFVYIRPTPKTIKELPTWLKTLKENNNFVILDISMIFSLLAFKNIEDFGDVGDIEGEVLEISRLADVLIFDASKDAFSHVGALLITDNEEIYRKFQSWVVSFEGLHTYGGLAGRDMEVIHLGLIEALRKDYYLWRYEEIKRFYEGVKGLGYRVSPKFSPMGFHIEVENPYGFNLALYLSGQVRAYAKKDELCFRIPRRTYLKEHFLYFLDVLNYLKDKPLPKLEADFETDFKEDEVLSFSINSQIPRYEVLPFKAYPYRFKSVEILTSRTREYREKVMEEAGFNTFLLRSRDVYIDLLTDSGTSAMSDEQWADGIRYDWKNAYEYLSQAVYEVFGFKYFIPTHQGRQAEHFISQALIKPGQYVINNMYFTTTRFHQEYAGGIFVDLIIPQAHDPDFEHPFKGNFDIDAVYSFIKEKGREKVAYICVETNVNMAGGQPVSMENIRKLREIADEFGIPLVFDATRIAENAYFIKVREKGYENKSIREIIREMLSYADAASISAKKDPLTNISGLLLIRNPEIYAKVYEFATAFDGSPYDGGLADRDLAILARGIYEMTEFEYLESRIKQVQYLGERLISLGIPVVKPIGGHAVYLNAKKFLPHIPQDEFPAQVLAAEIYIEGGVRTMERGTVSAGRDPNTGENRKPNLELVRITIPRRVYTTDHMDQVIEAILGVWNRREKIVGLEFVYEAPFLRFFTSKFRRKL